MDGYGPVPAGWARDLVARVAETGGRVWLRRLFASGDGRDPGRRRQPVPGRAPRAGRPGCASVTAVSAGRRGATPRSGTPTTWCPTPGAARRPPEPAGLCEACNYAKQAPGGGPSWTTPHPGHTVTTTTPTRARPPLAAHRPLPGDATTRPGPDEAAGTLAPSVPGLSVRPDSAPEPASTSEIERWLAAQRGGGPVTCPVDLARPSEQHEEHRPDHRRHHARQRERLRGPDQADEGRPEQQGRHVRALVEDLQRREHPAPPVVRGPGADERGRGHDRDPVAGPGDHPADDHPSELEPEAAEAGERRGPPPAAGTSRARPGPSRRVGAQPPGRPRGHERGDRPRGGDQAVDRLARAEQRRGRRTPRRRSPTSRRPGSPRGPRCTRRAPGPAASQPRRPASASSRAPAPARAGPVARRAPRAGAQQGDDQRRPPGRTTPRRAAAPSPPRAARRPARRAGGRRGSPRCRPPP